MLPCLTPCPLRRLAPRSTVAIIHPSSLTLNWVKRFGICEPLNPDSTRLNCNSTTPEIFASPQPCGPQTKLNSKAYNLKTTLASSEASTPKQAKPTNPLRPSGPSAPLPSPCPGQWFQWPCRPSSPHRERRGSRCRSCRDLSLGKKLKFGVCRAYRDLCPGQI